MEEIRKLRLAEQNQPNTYQRNENLRRLSRQLLDCVFDATELELEGNKLEARIAYPKPCPRLVFWKDMKLLTS